MGHSEYARIAAIERFEGARRRAQLNQLWGRFTKKRRSLLPFEPIYKRLLYPSGINLGIQQIPVRQIVGSLTRASNFDRDFRPLHRTQRARWVKVWALQAQRGWEPIVVHEIGGLYFVEDGHHRTSVARDAGLETIEAAVTSYPVAISLDPQTSLKEILVQLASRSLDQKVAPIPQCAC